MRSSPVGKNAPLSETHCSYVLYNFWAILCLFEVSWLNKSKTIPLEVPFYCCFTLILEKCHGMIGEHLNNVTNGRLPPSLFQMHQSFFCCQFFLVSRSIKFCFSDAHTHSLYSEWPEWFSTYIFDIAKNHLWNQIIHGIPSIK